MAAITVVLLAATLFVGCSLLTPSSPNLEYDKVSGVVRWNKVMFASSYEIKVVSEESGETVADTLFVPGTAIMDTLAFTPLPVTFIVSLTRPFLSVVILRFDAIPSTVIPPTPFGPLWT